MPESIELTTALQRNNEIFTHIHHDIAIKRRDGSALPIDERYDKELGRDKSYAVLDELKEGTVSLDNLRKALIVHGIQETSYQDKILDTLIQHRTGVQFVLGSSINAIAVKSGMAFDSQNHQFRLEIDKKRNVKLVLDGTCKKLGSGSDGGRLGVHAEVLITPEKVVLQRFTITKKDNTDKLANETFAAFKQERANILIRFLASLKNLLLPKNNHGITLFREKKTNRVPQPPHLGHPNGTRYGVTGRVRDQIKDNEKPNTEEIGTALASTSSAEPSQAAQISIEADKSSLIAAQKALDKSKETLYRTRLDVRRINEAMAKLPEYKVEFDSVSKELASIAAKIGVQRNKLGERERVLEGLDKELQDAEAKLANKKRDKVKLGPKYETTLRLNKAAVEEKKVKVESARQLVGEAKRQLASLDARKIDLEGRITSISIKIASAENRLANSDEVRANHNRALEGHQNAQRQRLFQARQFSSSAVSETESETELSSPSSPRN